MKILFVAGFGPITRDPKESAKLYMDTLGLTLERDDGDYFHTEALAGVKSFAVWPLAQAAESCFGTDTWPNELTIPRAWIEFDVDDVEAATKELVGKGYKPLVSVRKEPWGQVVTRLLSPEGLLLGITYTPWMREKK